MKWNKMYAGWTMHPKMTLLSKELSISRGEAVGLIGLIWDYLMLHAPDGVVTGKESLISVWCECKKPGLFSALIVSGWLDVQDGEFIIHNWVERNASDKLNAERQARFRNRNKHKRLESKTNSNGSNGYVTLRNVTATSRNASNVLDENRLDENGTASSGTSPDVAEIFEYWVSNVKGGGKWKLLPQRRKLIQRNLKAHSVEELKGAMDNLARNGGYQMGRDAKSNGKSYNDLTSPWFADASKLEQWVNHASRNRPSINFVNC